MIHVHRLGGCTPAPLAYYLKALGVLRLVAEQSDSAARGWWDGDHFQLATKLTREDLEEFFLRDYQPTPIVSPWNKGAGFFFENDPALFPIETSNSPRFGGFRAGINASRLQLGAIQKADQEIRDIKAEAKQRGMSTSEKNRIRDSKDYKDRLREAEKRFRFHKANLIPNLRLNWRGANREWMDTAMVLGDDGVPKYPALLGTGGNDGRLDFTSHFMKRIGEMFNLGSDEGEPRPAARAWVSGALWGLAVPGNLRGQPVGQYLPGTAGGANNSNGPDSDSMVNPLDYILMLEGSIAFTSHASRRLGRSDSSRAASPFVVNACGAAYSSASADDESAKGEQWMPLWSCPSSYMEIRQLLSEGRAQIGANTAREPLDLARAVRRLGTARGIKSFQRYGYIERNGQSNLAVPLGRINVASRHSEHVTCTDDIDLWLRRLRREARNRNAPTRLVAVEKRLVEALFAVTMRPERPGSWQGVLLRLTEVEETMAHGDGSAAQPIPPLRPEWVAASHDGTADFRLALAFALQSCVYRVSGRMVEDQIRRHWLPLVPNRPQIPLDPERKLRFATVGSEIGAKLDLRPEVVMRGRRSIDDAIALVERRMVETLRREGRYLPLKAAPGAAAGIADLTALLAGRVNLERVLKLARALTAVDRRAWAEWRTAIELPVSADWPDDAWLAVRLCALPWPIKTRSGFVLDIGTDLAVIRRLAAGDAATAVSTALRRLGAAGVRCTIRAGIASPDTARLWAAGLAFPITQGAARRFLYRLDPNKE